MDAGMIHQAVSVVCPIVGISMGNPSDRATWIIDFDPSATASQRAAALNVIATFTPVTPPLSDSIDRLAFKLMFNHENRIRTLEGKAIITVAQFNAALLAVLGG